MLWPLVFFVGLLFSAPVLSGQITYLFVGTYTDGLPANGIYVYEFNSRTGNLKAIGHAETIVNPSYLTLSSDGRFLYACTDTKLPIEGSVSAFAFDSIRGSLKLLNKLPAGGENPVYVTTTRGHRLLINANYTSGNVSVYSIKQDGGLDSCLQVIPFYGSSIIKDRQEKPHLHAVVLSTAEDFVFFPDLGTDKIHAFRLGRDTKTPLVPAEELTVTAKAGSGPRHFTFHPSGKFAYYTEELGGTVAADSYDSGRLHLIQRTTSYKQKQEQYSSADIHVSPGGLFLYASNRWEENTIAIFSIDQQTGKLKLVGHQSTFGDHPRNFTIDPSGNFVLVANQLTNDIVVFRRNIKTGLLTKVGERIKVPAPACLQMRVYNR